VASNFSRIIACWVFGLLIHAAPSSAAEQWVTGTVTSVHDGDTATVRTSANKRLRVRFYGVDAPERATEDWPEQAYAQEAAAFMRKLILNDRVKVRLVGERTYQREVGEIFTDGRSASRELVREGLGWWNAKFARDDLELKRLETAARRDRRGLWKSARPIPPWKYRNQHRRRRN
jgi:micrococcal nuclease